MKPAPDRNMLTPPNATEEDPLAPELLAHYKLADHDVAWFRMPHVDRMPLHAVTERDWKRPASDYRAQRFDPVYVKSAGWYEIVDYYEAIRSRGSQPMGLRWRQPSDYPSDDPESGWPRNPGGRTGHAGCGHLALWGPNPTLMLTFTRFKRNKDSQTICMAGGKPVIEALFMHSRDGQYYQFPWFFLKHNRNCDGNTCQPILLASVLHLLTQLANQSSMLTAAEKEAKLVTACTRGAKMKTLYKGYLDDAINCDNAWLEVAVINCQFNENKPLIFGILEKIFCSDYFAVEWVELNSQFLIDRARESHKEVSVKLLDMLNSSM
ncbi:Transient receptor putative cation channel subfamily M member 2 [Cichlidogyrus casuarinus]|uniref:Transient receptor putative cation channel subfamily M member 2 n=1 Tax=Cichlidogyrus casuarinus TaxID=1844966 RepID=A0ABD2PVZ0_9PLAT